MSFATVNASPGPQLPGQLAYRDDDNLFTTSHANTDTAAIAPGLGVIKDGTNGGVKLPTTGTGGACAGVVFDDGTLAIETAAYVAGATMPVLKRGQVMVKTFEAVKFGDAVTLTDTTGGTGAFGTFGKTTDGGKATAITTGFAWGQGSFDVGSAILEINLP